MVGFAARDACAQVVFGVNNAMSVKMMTTRTNVMCCPPCLYDKNLGHCHENARENSCREQLLNSTRRQALLFIAEVENQLAFYSCKLLDYPHRAQGDAILKIRKDSHMPVSTFLTTFISVFVSILLAMGCATKKPEAMVGGSQQRKIGTGTHSPKLAPALSSIIDKIEVVRLTAILGTSQNLSELSSPRVKVDREGKVQCYIFMLEWGVDAFAILKDRSVVIETTKEKQRLVQGWVPAERLVEVANLEFVSKIQPPDYGIKLPKR